MLAVLALAAFMSDAGAQTRRSSQSSQTRSSSQSSQTRSSSQSSQTRRATSGSQTRQSSNDNKKSTAARPSTPSRQQSARPSSGADRKPSTTVTRPSSKPSVQVNPSAQSKPSVQARPSAQSKPSVQVNSSAQSRPASRPAAGAAAKPKPSTPDKPDGNKSDFKPGDQNKPVQVTRPAPNRPQGNNKGDDRPGVRPDSGPGGKHDGRPDAKPGHGHGKPVQIRPDHRHDRPRVHPRDRDFMRWDRPSYWWSHSNHYYGYRVRVLPTHVHRHVYHGITYYCYNDIWYRPYGGYYVVCRPPYGLALAANIISDLAWASVRLSYYNTVANTYSQINENNAYIAEQNAIIAQNNATIAAQNAAIAQNQQLAQTSYTLANQLGLIQSYAAADSEYFYQDGVFYAKDARGEYNVIVPPAGALVETLPEDFDMVTLADGNEYYKVDDTIYKVTVLEGKPYFEVIGQQY